VRPSLRFLGLAVVGWAAFRAATVGIIPGALWTTTSKPAETAPSPALIATQFPPIEPIAPAPAPVPLPYQDAASPYGAPYYYPNPPGYAAPASPPVRPVVVPVYVSYRTPPQAQVVQPAVWPLPEPYRQFYQPPKEDEWVASHLGMTGAAIPAQSRVTEPMQSTAPAVIARRLDRIQLTMWAMLRSRQDLTGTTSLAGGGQLGGSQAGARLFYNVTPAIAAVLRSSSEVGRRGGELAAGVRVHPLRSIPVWVTAERRFQLGKYGGGRNAFALFAETGIYGRPMPFDFTLDAYAQGGVVGLSSRDLFFDGAATFTRPVFRQFSAGFGVWGGVQPGLYRVDAGPRISMQVRRNVRVHFDYRQRLSGNAEPGSGPVVTLAGDF